MCEFRSINELRCDYYVKAAFYKVGEIVYRKCADIIRKGYDTSKVDLNLILMNPGKCYICEESKIDTFDDWEDMIGKKIEMRVVRDDPTQKRVMQLMDNLNLNKVRIFNLCDYREPSSKKFINIVNDIPKEAFIFDCKERREELDSLFDKEICTVIAWGVAFELDCYKERALKYLRNIKIVGKNKEGCEYYHISPTGYGAEEKAKNIVKELVRKIREDV